MCSQRARPMERDPSLVGTVFVEMSITVLMNVKLDTESRLEISGVFQSTRIWKPKRSSLFLIIKLGWISCRKLTKWWL